MQKYCIYLVLWCFVLIAFSCREDNSRPVDENVSELNALSSFEEYLTTAPFDSAGYDSVIYKEFIRYRSTLQGIENLKLYRRIGEFFYNNEIQDSALMYFKEGLELAKVEKNQYYISVFHMMIGSVHTALSDFEPALEEMKSAYSIAMTIDSAKLQIRTSRVLGNVYWNMGNYDLALEYYIISLNISQKAENKLGISSALNNIGNVYQEIKNYDRAIEYYKQSEEIAEKENFARILAITNNNLGDIFILKKEYDSALFYFNKALFELKKDNSRIDAGIYIGNIADVYLKTDSLEKSRQYFFESLKLAEQIGDKTGIASCYLGLADLNIRENNIKLATDFLNKGTSISEEIGSLKLMDYAYGLNSKVYTGKFDYQKAHQFLSRQMAIKDSIYSLEMGQNVARLESQYKEVQSIKEIELLKEKQKNILYLFILGFAAIFIISVIIFIAFRQKIRSNKLLKEKNQLIEVSRKVLEEKNQLLTESQEQLSRINKGKDDFLTVISHDLKNPLSSIRGFTELLVKNYDSLSDEKRKAFLNEVFDSIERISLLISNILYWVKSQTQELTVKPVRFNLLKRVNENVSIYNLMIANKKLDLQVKVPEDIHVLADMNIFDMILRNMLSNALKFTEEKGKITISCEAAGERIRLNISDNGVGIPEDKLKLILSGKGQYSTVGTRHEQGTGLGLGLTYRFIEQAGGSFDIRSEQGKGTTASFTLEVTT